jgi:ribose 5-phosphate isomerase A
MQKNWDELRKLAARKALDDVKNGMCIGLGTGRTTTYFIDYLGEALQQGTLTGIAGVPTSQATAAQAQRLNIPLTSLSEHARLDLAVDGADEVDPHLNLIKGLGKALLREKIVEIHAERLIIVVDEAKMVAQLGEKVALPVEITPFEAAASVRWLNSLGCRAELWLEEDGSPTLTDNGNYLARCWFSQGIENATDLACRLSERPGIVEHGLFLNMASKVIVAGAQGIEILERV